MTENTARGIFCGTQPNYERIYFNLYANFSRQPTTIDIFPVFDVFRPKASLKAMKSGHKILYEIEMQKASNATESRGSKSHK